LTGGGALCDLRCPAGCRRGIRAGHAADPTSALAEHRALGRGGVPTVLRKSGPVSGSAPARRVTDNRKRSTFPAGGITRGPGRNAAQSPRLSRYRVADRLAGRPATHAWGLRGRRRQRLAAVVFHLGPRRSLAGTLAGPTAYLATYRSGCGHHDVHHSRTIAAQHLT